MTGSEQSSPGRSCSLLESGLALLLRISSPGPLHIGLHLLRSESAIFVGVHSFEDPLVSRMKFLHEMVPSPSLSIRLKMRRIMMGVAGIWEIAEYKGDSRIAFAILT